MKHSSATPSETPISAKDIADSFADLKEMWSLMTDLCKSIPGGEVLASRRELPPIVKAIFDQAARSEIERKPDYHAAFDAFLNLRDTIHLFLFESKGTDYSDLIIKPIVDAAIAGTRLSATEQKNAAPQVSDIAMPDVLEIAEVLLMWRQGASQYLYQSEDAWKTARVVRTDRLLNTLKAAPLSDTAEFSLGGCAPRLYGASGTTGALGPFGLTVHDDHALPDDVLEFRDHITGRVLAKIINVGKS